jgi:hypothetical protein
MRLYHTTSRDRCDAIASAGFTESRAGKYGPGVYLAEGPFTREFLTLDPTEAHLLEPHLVVFAFDIPDELARSYACGGVCYLSPDDPEYDPEIDTPEPGCEGLKADEWPVPAEVANRHFAGLVHWTGEPPLNAEQLAVMTGRVVSRVGQEEGCR